jgi:hypothetical protein
VRKLTIVARNDVVVVSGDGKREHVIVVFCDRSRPLVIADDDVFFGGQRDGHNLVARRVFVRFEEETTTLNRNKKKRLLIIGCDVRKGKETETVL